MKREEMTSQDRKDRPIFSGVLKYFPDALLEVAELSRIANDKHNPGEPLHWSKDKSNDHGDALVRHQLDAGTWDMLEGHRVRHSAEVAWRALAQLQTEIENERDAAQFIGTGLPLLPEQFKSPATDGVHPMPMHIHTSTQAAQASAGQGPKWK